MIQNIAAAVLILGALVLGIGLWGRFWVRSGTLNYLQPTTRLGLMLLGGVLIFGGYWYSFGGVFGKPVAPKVWTTSGVTLAPEKPATAPEVTEPLAGSAQSAEPELVTQAEQAEQTLAATPATGIPVETPAAVEAPAPAAETSTAAVSSETAETPAPPIEAAPQKPATAAAAPAPEPAALVKEQALEAPAPPVERKPVAARRSGAAAKAHRDGSVDVCAVQVQYGVVPARHGRQAITDSSTRISIRNALGPGQIREKLDLLIEGRKVASFEISRKKPSVNVSVSLPRGTSASYSLAGTTEYEDGERRKVSGGGWLEDGVRRYDLRSTGGWDARGGELFLEPAS